MSFGLNDFAALLTVAREGQILFDTNRVRQQIGRKQFCERRLLVQHLDHGFFVYAHEPGVFRGGRDRRPKRLSGAKCEVVKFCC